GWGVGGVVGVRAEEAAPPPQHFGPVVVGHAGPHTGLGGFLGAGDRVVDGFGTAVGEFGDLLFGGRVDDRNHLTGAGSLADVVEYVLHRHGRWSLRFVATLSL